MAPTNMLGWSDWTAPMLAEGWVKRVLTGINPFEQRIQTYGNNQPNTIVSMISQAGPPISINLALAENSANLRQLHRAFGTPPAQ
jgi:hypothetical protein